MDRRLSIGTSCLVAAMSLGVPSPAHADDNGPLAALLVLAVYGGAGLGALPLLIAQDENAPLFFDVQFGAAGELDAFAFVADLEGSFERRGLWGFSSRAQSNIPITEAGPDDLFVPDFRFDLLGRRTLVVESEGQLTVDALAGVTIWPSVADRDREGESEVYGSVGPFAGLRSEVRTEVFQIALEGGYLPLLFESPTKRAHHVEVGAEVRVPVWDAIAFTVEFRRLVGLGGPVLYKGAEITGGITFDTNELEM